MSPRLTRLQHVKSCAGDQARLVYEHVYLTSRSGRKESLILPPGAMSHLEKLKNGETVTNYREGGNSMRPIIKNRQPVTLRPIRDRGALEKGDIVHVKVNGRRYTHLVIATRNGQVQIGNNHGGVNGWTSVDNVYGIVTEIDGAPHRNSQYPST
jgi:hypothetical protein